jgi:hypothetical protein
LSPSNSLTKIVHSWEVFLLMSEEKFGKLILDDMHHLLVEPAPPRARGALKNHLTLDPDPAYSGSFKR